MMYTLLRRHSTISAAMLHMAYEKRAHVPVLFARPQLKRVSYARAYMRGIRLGLDRVATKRASRNSARPIF